MLDKLKLSILLQGLTLVLLGPACEASSLGLTVHVVPLDSDGGNMVQAHFSVIAPSPCPDTSGLCAVGEDCLVHKTLETFSGTKPDSGWCVRQWQKTVPSNYTANISLGSNTNIYVSLKTEPKVRVNSGRLNQPAYVALPPPLRARVNCPHHFHLSVKDMDGDRVRCRFARPEEGECVNCTKHDFIELNEDQCMFRFSGAAPAGQYFIYLMAEDLIPVPRMSYFTNNTPLSAVPMHLSLTVEESTSSCSAEPVVTGDTPEEDTTLFVLPYQQVQFSASFKSMLESVSEVAVVGPPELYRAKFTSVSSAASIEMAWVRSENKLARLLPVCFAANTKSLQSEPRCVWLYQREMGALPAGTELTCENTEMTLVLPISSLSNINLAELQLNSPTCPVTYNDTHLTAVISLVGCGTKRVHSGSEMIYTNTLHSVRPYTMVSRKPSLILPLACRIPGTNVSGPHYKIGMPTEEETFGEVAFTIQFYFPGEGPLSNFTSSPVFRSLKMDPLRMRREAESPSKSKGTSTSSIDNSTSTRGAIGSKITSLDLYVQSNCSIDRAELIVSNCVESETSNFTTSTPILQQGCTSSDSTLEIITTETNSKVYRLDLSSAETEKSTMYVQCTVNLCIATMPSQKCPDLCSRSFGHRSLVGSVFTRSYTVTSGPVSLVVTTPAPTTTAAATTPAATPAATTAAATTAAATTAAATTAAATTAAATTAAATTAAATTAAATTAAATTAAATTAAATTAAATTAAATTAAATTAAATTAAATTAAATTAAATTATVTNTTTSHAPEQASAMATGLILTTIGIFLQNIFL